jgi:carboxyl-terminal processing protease
MSATDPTGPDDPTAVAPDAASADRPDPAAAPGPVDAPSPPAWPTPTAWLTRPLPPPSRYLQAAPVAAATTRSDDGRADRTLVVVVLALAIIAILAGAALFLSGYSLGRQDATTPGTGADEQELFAPFWDTYRAITERYAGGDIDERALIEGAIKGMVEALGDPYSSYLTPEEYKQSLEDINGQFEGIGAEIGTRGPDGSAVDCATLGPDCRLVIIAPLAGSPAEQAGVQAGDLVLAVDGATLDGLSVDEARDRIRGPKGTTVVLTVERDGQAPDDIAITRDVIEQVEVEARDLAGGAVGYVKVSGFSSDAAADVETAIRADVAKGQTKLILDLRGNPGGFVDAARDIASQFIGSGPLFWQEDADGNQIETDAKPGGAATDPAIDLVVLIDRGSASASEIVAGAIQDTGRGRLVGERTFGKGTVQQWNVLEGDNGGFRLTVARWLTPDKRWIHSTGLTPDVAVDVPSDTPSGEDPILDRAVELLTAATTADRRLPLAA